MRQRSETDRIRLLYERMAPAYDRQLDPVERFFFPDGRGWVGERARGDVLEIGAGTGRNLPVFPADARVTAVDLSAAMLDVARRRAASLGRAFDLRVGDVQALAFDDASFDTVVGTLVLCTVADPARVVGEVRRVLRPRGRFVFVEHVRSPNALVRAGEMLLDPLFERFAADHLLREPVELLQRAGFRFEELDRRRWGIVEQAVAIRS